MEPTSRDILIIQRTHTRLDQLNVCGSISTSALQHLMDNKYLKSNYFLIQKSQVEQTTSITLNEVSWAFTELINSVY